MEQKFIDFLNEQRKLEERLLAVGGKLYPRQNNVLILAGGAGSGKGFILKNVIGFEGKVFDVDALKTKIIDHAKDGYLADLGKEFYDKYGLELGDVNTKDAPSTTLVHEFLKERGISNKQIEYFFKTRKDGNRKDNVIFDVTLKNINKLKEIANYCNLGDYKVENRHIVWVLSSIENALEQNATRERTVDPKILFKTHKGASLTLKELIQNSNKYRKYFDGDIFIVFNIKNIDTFSTVKINKKGKKESLIIDKYTAVKIKDQYVSAKSFDEIGQEIIDKINAYVPQEAQW